MRPEPIDNLGLGEIVEPSPPPRQSPEPGPTDPGPSGKADSGPASGGIDDQWTPEAAAELAIGLINIVCSKAWAMPLDDSERAMLNKGMMPAARKYCSVQISPEWMAIGVVAAVTVPRMLMSAMTAEEPQAPIRGSDDDRSSVRGQGGGEKPRASADRSEALGALADILRPSA